MFYNLYNNLYKSNFNNYLFMAEKNFAEKISAFKYAMIGAQKTLLSQVSEVVPLSNIITKGDCFSQRDKVPLVVAIFGDSMSIVYDAAIYLSRYHERYGKYPTVVCLPGLSESKYIDYGMPIVSLMRHILLGKGIPEEYIYCYEQDVEKCGPVAVLNEFLNNVAHYIHDVHVAVFAARGYSVSTILALRKGIPNGNFMVFHKEYVSPEYLEEHGIKSTCIFDTDRLDSIGLDLILGELVRLHLEYKSLPAYFKQYIIPLDKVKKFTDKGYILGLNTEAEMNAVGISLEKFNEMLPKRLADFEWVKNAKVRLYEQIMYLNEACD